MIFGALFFAACAAVLFYSATTTNGLIVNHVIELGRRNASILLFVMGACSLAFVGIALFSLVRGRELRELVIELDTITFPSPLWRRNNPTTVRFASIIELRESSVSGQVFLTVHTRDAKYSIGRSHLPAGAFDEVVALVQSRVDRSRISA